MRRNLKIKNKISIWYHVLSYLRSSLYLLCYISKKAVKKYYRYMVFCQDNVCFGWYDSTSEKKTLSTVLAVFGCNAAHHGKRSLTCPADSTHLCQQLLSGSQAGWKLVLPTKRERYEALHKKAYIHYSQMSVGSKDRQGPTLDVYLRHVSVKRAGVDCILMRLFASHRIHIWSVTEECRDRVFHLFCRKEWFSIYELCCTQAEIKEIYRTKYELF